MSGVNPPEGPGSGSDWPATGGSPEYLDQNAGGPLATTATPRRSRKKPLLIAGGVVIALGAAGGAWALTSFLSQGPQPAVALPSETVAYASIDLDPSGGQKIEALRTLNKFPSFKDKVGLSTSDDIRRKMVDEFNKQSECKVDYGKDVEPWLGDRAAVAAVDVGEQWPAAVEVVQVKDDAKAEAGIKKLIGCAGAAANDAVAYSVHDGWAVLGSKQDQVDKIVALTKSGNLADDAAYQKWTSSVGDPGIVNVYVAPSAGDYLAKGLDRLGGAFSGLGDGGLVTQSATAAAVPSSYEGKAAADCSGSGTNPLGPAADMVRSFNGMALTVRFHDGALEVESAVDSGQSATGSDQGDAMIGTLPADTPAALGLSIDPEWLSHLADQMASMDGCSSADDLVQQWSQASGLDLPADFKTLVGSSVSVSLGKDFDPQTAEESSNGVGVPAAVKIKGDPTAIRGVLDKLSAKGLPGSAATALQSDDQGDVIVVGPTPAYRQQLLANGGLGQSSTYRDVISHSAGNSAVLFVNLDDVRTWVTSVEQDPEVEANMKPLAALGISAWMDGKVSHALFRVTTH
ncbi:MAG: DUF3352 domain-containing protein [Nocardioides sp.]